jgi:hypothetical protein
MFLDSICPIIIESIAAYPDLFLRHFMGSTHFYQHVMNIHWCYTFHIHKLHHIAYFHIYLCFQ